jgi:NAD(P)H-hydrate epimerase
MTLPKWLVGLPDSERMRATDAWAIEERGIPSEQLMERAGAGLARMTGDVAPHGLVAVVCGGGNNGGDGYVAARLLRKAGRDVRVVAVTPVDALRGDARLNAERLPGDAPERFGPAALDGAAVAIDALLGTGFAGAPREPARAAIAALNALGAPVVAADVASGVDASTGVVEAEAVRAAVTVTFAACKPGHWINPGKAHTGEVHTVDIGIPEGAPVEPPDVGLIDDAVLNEVPSREAGWTKFTSGHVIVAGGARGLSGAPCLAAEAAMRAGAGYVTALVPASLEPVFEQRLLEVMTRGLPDADGAHTREGADAVLQATGRGGSLVLGPGLSRAAGALAFAREVARRAEVPLVLDADGLNAHAGRLDDLSARSAPTVLTPHAGELGRLLGVDSAEVDARRLEHARAAAAKARAVVVLKGDDTLVADPGGLVAVSAGATPALATAGTGDVLTGVIGAVLARGVDAFTVAAAAVRLHALAGIGAALERGVDAVIARDVIEGLRR